jgi:NADPH:quinone reductase-like Zn-dependent oxidoreductase
MAVAPGAFATHVVVESTLVARKPRNLSHQQAAALPIAFLTAIHALDTCGRMRSGDNVLIHAASGGVGLAAMQLARLAGARILATAGSEEKRAFVREQAADTVMNSRSLTFADEARSLTGGVDIILNSLPGEAIARGIEALAIGGRFLEIGKRDIYADAALSL